MDTGWNELALSENRAYWCFIGNKVCSRHCEQRIATSSLQGAGLCKDGLTVATAMRVWTMASESVLTASVRPSI